MRYHRKRARPLPAMPSRISTREPIHSPSAGRCYLYVFPCAYEDLLKLGISRDPLDRIQAFSRRYFEFFDLQRGWLLETDSVREAQSHETRLRRSLRLLNAPAPLLVPGRAAGATEWYRGASALLEQAQEEFADQGYSVHRPLEDWLRTRLHARRGDLFSWAERMLSAADGEPGDAHPVGAEPPLPHRMLRDALDGYAALGLSLEDALPPAVADWYARLR
jgi:hypothetical protein